MQQQYKFKQEIIEQKMYMYSYFLISCHAIAQTKQKKKRATKTKSGNILRFLIKAYEIDLIFC